LIYVAVEPATMYFAIQECWSNTDQYHPLYVGALLIVSNSVLCFSFSALCHMLWWRWFTIRQREASAYAFLVAVVLNTCLMLKWFFPSPRPHPGPQCAAGAETLFGEISGSWPSTHVTVAVFMGLFYTGQLWAWMFPVQCSPGEKEEEEEEGEAADDLEKGEAGTGGLEHLNLRDLLGSRKTSLQKEQHEHEGETMGKLEGFARIACIVAYVGAVTVSRLQLELNHAQDATVGALLGAGLYFVFCVVYKALANRLTSRSAASRGEKIE